MKATRPESDLVIEFIDRLMASSGYDPARAEETIGATREILAAFVPLKDQIAVRGTAYVAATGGVPLGLSASERVPGRPALKVLVASRSPDGLKDPVAWPCTNPPGKDVWDGEILQAPFEALIALATIFSDVGILDGYLVDGILCPMTGNALDALLAWTSDAPAGVSLPVIGRPRREALLHEPPAKLKGSVWGFSFDESTIEPSGSSPRPATPSGTPPGFPRSRRT